MGADIGATKIIVGVADLLGRPVVEEMIETPPAAVADAVDADGLVDLVRSATRIPSVTGDEAEFAMWVRDQIPAGGWDEVRASDVAPGRPNVYAFAGGEGGFGDVRFAAGAIVDGRPIRGGDEADGGFDVAIQGDRDSARSGLSGATAEEKVELYAEVIITRVEAASEAPPARPRREQPIPPQRAWSGHTVDVTITANTLTKYVPALRESDDDFRLRLVLHDFGMVYQHANSVERTVLLEAEPEPFDRRWDAFLAAYAEYLSYHADLASPAWVRYPYRYLREFWYPVRRFPRERAGTILTTPGAFEAHGIWFPVRELEVV